MNLGEIVKAERRKQGISQQKLADAAGVTKRALNYWEKGTKHMNLESADKVLKALGISFTIGEQ